MRIAIVLDPLEQIKTYKDSTYAMMVAAHARGHEVHVCEQGELSLVGGRVLAVIRRLTAERANHCRVGPCFRRVGGFPDFCSGILGMS